MGRNQPRTLLEQLIQQREQTLADAAREFEALANQLGEPATMSPRHLRRWLSGEASNAYPATRRIAQRLWGAPFEDLIGPPGVLPAVEAVPVPQQPLVYPPVGGGAGVIPAAGAAFTEELAMAAEDSARFVRRARTVLGPEVLEQLDADVVHLAEQYMRTTPYAMFRPLAELRRDVFELIDGHPRPEHARELYRVAGLVSALLAHLSSDLGYAYGVDTHTRMALTCADLSGADQLRGYVHWVRSQVAYWQKDFRRSAELARRGLVTARAGSDVLRLASQEARALAALGDERETTLVLQRAVAARDDAVGQRPEPGVFYFAPGKAAYYAAEAHLALGGPQHLRQAVADAEESLQLFATEPGSSPELMAAAQLDLVTAHVTLDDLDSGAAGLAQVLQLPSESRTVPVIERSAKIAASLNHPRYATSQMAMELRDQLDQFVAYPAAKELPSLPA